MTGWKPKTAMVLAAGLGKRMRPITETMPKPLVPVAGKTLLDWGLDMLAVSGVEKAVVNVHYLPDQIIAHVAGRKNPHIVVSDERHGLLDWPAGSSRLCRNSGPSRSTCSTPTRSGLTGGFPISTRSPLNGMRRGWIFS